MPDLPVGAPYRCSSPYPATRPAGVSTATSPRTDACHRLPEPRHSRSRGRRLRLSRREDDTRMRWRNDTPWGGGPCRTYKHYVLSPDPKDHVGLDVLRELTAAGVRGRFGDHEVAIVYHDNNTGRIPHAHVVVNNTNIVTGQRLQDPAPKELKHSLQRMAKECRLSDFDSAEENTSARGRARCRQSTYVVRSERSPRGRLLLGGGSAPASALRAPSRGARTSSRGSSRTWA